MPQLNKNVPINHSLLIDLRGIIRSHKFTAGIYASDIQSFLEKEKCTLAVLPQEFIQNIQLQKHSSMIEHIQKNKKPKTQREIFQVNMSGGLIFLKEKIASLLDSDTGKYIVYTQYVSSPSKRVFIDLVIDQEQKQCTLKTGRICNGEVLPGGTEIWF